MPPLRDNCNVIINFRELQAGSYDFVKVASSSSN